MGLTVFRGELPTLEEAKIAKNHLSEKELKGLNTLVSGLLDFAERQAQKEVIMTMNDWLKYVDKMLRATGEKNTYRKRKHFKRTSGQENTSRI